VNQISYVTAPTYPANTYVYPAATVAAPTPSPAEPVGVDARRRRCHFLRCPMWMSIFASALLLTALFTPHWFEATRVAQDTIGSGNPVVTTKLSVGLFRGHTESRAFTAGDDSTPVEAVTRGHFNCGHLSGHAHHDCGRLRHTLAPLTIASASITLFVVLMIIADRCGKFGTTRKVWIGPFFQLAALIVSAVALSTVHRIAGAQRHEATAFTSGSVPEASSSVTVFALESHPGCSAHMLVIALILQIFSFFKLLRRAIKARCCRGEGSAPCRRWRLCGRSAPVLPPHA